MRLRPSALALAAPSAFAALLSLAPPGHGATGAEDHALLAVALEAGPANEHLPLDFARRALVELDVVLHGTELGEDALLVAALDGSKPTLMLYSPHFLGQDSLAPPSLVLVELTLDSTGALFRGLLEAYLELALEDPGYQTVLQDRATRVMEEVPETYRAQAYREALVDFGGHLLATANELERVHRRHQARGSNLCVHWDRTWSLFGLWDRIFANHAYQGRYSTENGTWIDAPPLVREDKELFVKHVLEGFWTGDRQADLAARYCPSSSEPAG